LEIKSVIFGQVNKLFGQFFVRPLPKLFLPPTVMRDSLRRASRWNINFSEETKGLQ